MIRMPEAPMATILIATESLQGSNHSVSHSGYNPWNSSFRT